MSEGFTGHTHSRPIPQVLSLFERRLKEQSGTVLDETCRGEELPEVPGVGIMYTGGCGGHTRVAFPYENEDEDISTVELCAVCDCAYFAPRFLKDA
jgi:hypothetical protein